MSKHAIGKKFHSQNKFIDTALFPEAQRNGTKKLYYSPPLPCPAALQSIFTREYRGSTHRARVEVNFQKKLRNNIFSSRTKKAPILRSVSGPQFLSRFQVISLPNRERFHRSPGRCQSNARRHPRPKESYPATRYPSICEVRD